MITVLRWRQSSLPAQLRWRGPDAQMAEALAMPQSQPLAAIVGPPGAPGPQGQSGNGYLPVNGEVPAGVIDGVNPTFTLAHPPVWLVLFLDGIRLNKGAGNDYLLVGNVITMLTPPQPGQIPSADYLY